MALARIWLVQPHRGCTGCPTPAECRRPSECLHLVASNGRSAVDSARRVDAAGRGVPPLPAGRAKVGRIAATGEPLEAPDLSPAPPDWAASPEWLRAEGIAGFGGQPLVHRGQVLGVLAVFARGPIGAECMDWLRTIADHAAAAIATARAFERIEALKTKLELENEYLREEVTRAGAFGELVGQGPALEAVARQIDLVAPTDSAVLILGESGTGKELVAREVHRRSRRAARPLVKVNCAAVPRELYESEFFGHAGGRSPTCRSPRRSDSSFFNKDTASGEIFVGLENFRTCSSATALVGELLERARQQRLVLRHPHAGAEPDRRRCSRRCSPAAAAAAPPSTARRSSSRRSSPSSSSASSGS